MLDLVLSKHSGPVIAPMTLVLPAYFTEIVGRLRERGLGHAVAFVAGKGAALRGESFAVSKLDDCLAGLREPEFAEQVWTDQLTIRQVADRIAGSAGLTLAPNTDGVLRGRLRRARIGVRHIRL